LGLLLGAILPKYVGTGSAVEDELETKLPDQYTNDALIDDVFRYEERKRRERSGQKVLLVTPMVSCNLIAVHTRLRDVVPGFMRQFAESRLCDSVTNS